MQKTNKIGDLIKGLKLLKESLELGNEEDATFSFDVVHKSFPGGAPDHSNQGYLSVEMDGILLHEDDVAYLKELGFHPECDGEYWCFSLG